MITLIVSSTITRLTAPKTRDNSALEATCPVALSGCHSG